MDINNKNLLEFIKYIIQFDNINDILNKIKDDNNKGQVFERICDILIKLNFCDKFNNIYKHKIGNFNLYNLKTLKSLNSYLSTNKICSGNTNCI